MQLPGFAHMGRERMAAEAAGGPAGPTHHDRPGTSRGLHPFPLRPLQGAVILEAVMRTKHLLDTLYFD